MTLRPNAPRAVLGLVAMAALAWFVLRPAPRDVLPESSRDGEGTEPEAPTTLRAPPVTRDPRRDAGSSPDAAATKSAGAPGVAAPLTLAGRVVLPTGKPGIGTRIYASPASSDSRLIGWSTEADASGGFAFESLATPGEYALRAELTEGGEWFGSTTAHTGDRDVLLSLRPGVGPDTILVRVLGSDGAPVASAIGALRTTSSHSDVRVEQGRLFFDVRSHANDDLASAYVLVFRPKGPGGAPLASGDARLDGVRGGGIYELRLPQEVYISGVVVGPDGRGVAGAPLGAVRVDDAYEFDRKVCRDDVGGWGRR